MNSDLPCSAAAHNPVFPSKSTYKLRLTRVPRYQSRESRHILRETSFVKCLSGVIATTNRTADPPCHHQCLLATRHPKGLRRCFPDYRAAYTNCEAHSGEENRSWYSLIRSYRNILKSLLSTRYYTSSTSLSRRTTILSTYIRHSLQSRTRGLSLRGVFQSPPR